MAAKDRKDKNNSNESGVACSFCGKSREDVRRLISGPGVYICDECIEQCSAIISESWEDENEKVSPPNLMKPAEIKKALDQYIIGQSRAKKSFRSPSTIITKGLGQTRSPKTLSFRRGISSCLVPQEPGKPFWPRLWPAFWTCHLPSPMQRPLPRRAMWVRMSRISS